MEVLILTVFISLVLVVGALIFLLKGVRQGDYEHGDRLSLLPLEPDEGPYRPGHEGTTPAPGPDPGGSR